MMGRRQVDQGKLFYEFSLETHVPADHLLRSIDRFVEFDELRRELASYYSKLGRPSVDPELMMRMLIVGYCFGIRSERRFGLDGQVPDHSTFSKNRHGRFRKASRATRACHQKRQAARLRSISQSLTTRPSAQQLKSRRSSSRLPIQRHAGPARMAAKPSSPIRPTT
jgi:Transposase domain (DUF772)